MGESKSIEMEKNRLSRRAFLAGTTGFAIGVAVGSGGLGLLSGCTSKPEEKHKWPWPYKKIDPNKAAKIAYENWYKDFCSYAVASAILIPLQETVGEPYASFPVESTRWGHGGVLGWGTICGTLLGAGFATGLIAGREGEKILNDVMAWYTQTNLPIYTPASPKANIKNKSTSNSPLCHISVGRWMEKEDVKFFSPERKERCARLSADVAVKTVELLNDWADGKYKPVHGSQAKTHQMPSQNNCVDCHGSKIPKLPGV
ncbi:C-GCAxxG-C-C family protein [Candidatus Pyrohabitans sp.]